MFKKCIIKQVIIEAYQRGYSFSVMRRYLKVFYGINITSKALSLRFYRLYLQGKLPILKTKKIINDTYWFK